MKASVASAENVRTEARHETFIAGERLFRDHVIEVRNRLKRGSDAIAR